jgi:four helix bundle suffix protein
MIQSARSGKKNILEGSKAGLTSKETEIKLTNVARASLEERRLPRLPAGARTSRVGQNHQGSSLCPPAWPQDPTDLRALSRVRGDRPPEVVANIALCLIHQANYLIDQQLRRLEKDFLEQGGLRERMTRARLQYRRKPQ